MAKKAGEYVSFFDFAERKWRLPASIVRVFFRYRVSRTRAGAGGRLNLTHCDDTKASMWRDFSCFGGRQFKWENSI
jgi:hypothetical protein